MTLQAESDSIVYPVLSLPSELASFIFFHCTPSSTPPPQPSSLESPLRLSQVCRHWRDIAISTPELWQCIAFVSPVPSDLRSVEMLGTWLSRSGRHPLNISLDCVDPEYASHLIDACRVHAHRWQDTDLTLLAEALARLEDPL
ncbi:hypothetical protein DFH07DRAFT_1068058 [Mycena maculata]|uniref:F-box domain-containing protein n=1 Tax=Mycena maculata TaxID=230809 RepID=A0AAD7HDN1_9AGAR|nr:hypothetical protein DFH07DRAFT_1068058 [Mycena maculata]